MCLDFFLPFFGVFARSSPAATPPPHDPLPSRGGGPSCTFFQPAGPCRGVLKNVTAGGFSAVDHGILASPSPSHVQKLACQESRQIPTNSTKVPSCRRHLSPLPPDPAAIAARPMRALILAYGLPADVEPYVALGAALAAAGHVCTVCTHAQRWPELPKRAMARNLEPKTLASN